MNNPPEQPQSHDSPLYSMQQITELTGLTEHEVLLCYQAGWVQTEPAAHAALQFDDAALYNLRRLAQIRSSYRITLPAAALICQLIDEIERLRADLDFWRNR